MVFTFHLVKIIQKKFAQNYFFTTFAIPFEGNNIGEMAEWSNAAVLKTVDLNGSGGSNPSLSALKSLQVIEFQSCRLFLCPKSCTKNAPNPAQRKIGST